MAYKLTELIPGELYRLNNCHSFFHSADYTDEEKNNYPQRTVEIQKNSIVLYLCETRVLFSTKLAAKGFVFLCNGRFVYETIEYLDSLLHNIERI